MEFDNRIKLNIVTWFITLSTVFCSVQPPSINPALLNAPQTIGECQSCKIFVESFKKGLERTARGKYEGGDAAWEEEKLKKTYKRSEIRLVDIQEGICKEETKYDIQCHHVANKAEEYIEEWWAQDPDESEDLYSYICIEKLKFCCPKNHFGKDCMLCLGDHANLCSGNGKCRGDGTRKGNGTCLCDVGYMGDNCDQCSIGYYISYKDDNKMLCSECHKGCLGGCRGGSQKDCVACKPGFILDSNDGCVDINECDDVKRCKENQFCLNSLGSYTCMTCDKACQTCYSAGPDMCIKCAQGYSKKGEFCIYDRKDEDNSDIMTTTRDTGLINEDVRNVSMNVNALRFESGAKEKKCKIKRVERRRIQKYFTYIGLLIATGILLPKSTTLGSIVGMMVMSYIMGAEYYCMINGHTGLVNLTNYDLFQLLRT